MKALAITNIGIEDVASREVMEILGVEPSVRKGCVLFGVKDAVDLCKLCYKAQSLSRVILLLGMFNFKGNPFEHLKNELRNTGIEEWIKCKTKFVVRCKRIGKHTFSSKDIERLAGQLIIEKTEASVELNEPEVIFFIYINDDTCYFGIDFSGHDLSKRDYKIFSTPMSLKGTIAYAVVRIANFDKGVMLDPFMHDGSIVIESALFFSGVSPHYYKKDKFAFLRIPGLGNFDSFFESLDKRKNFDVKIYASTNSFNHLTSAKKNAKIAGVHKLIRFSRVDTEWLDTKYGKESVDCIVTLVPGCGKHANKKEVTKQYQDLFYNSGYILRESGKVVTISQTTELLKEQAERYKFRVAAERDVMQGEAKFTITTFCL